VRAFCAPWWRLLVAALWCACGLAWAQPLQPVPALAGRVVDTTGTLDALQQGALEQSLAAIEKDRGTQVVVLLVPTTAPEDIASYANRVANAWKIGRRDIGDGVLLLVAKDDRKLRIEVAKTLEGAIPDLAAKRIIDEAITPRLRQGEFAGGLQAGVAQIDARVRGEALPLPTPPAERPGLEGDWSAQLPVLLIAAFVFVPLVAGVLRRVLGRKLGARATGAGVGGFVWLILQLGLALALVGGVIGFVVALLSGNVGGSLPRSGRRGSGGIGHGGWIGGAGGAGWGGGGFGGGRGGGGGGFSSGGGGDFGGGGASGDW
jgi:uncharacterized protein